MELDETDVIREDLRVWKNCDAAEHRPPVMVIELYVDTEGLTHNQSLVILDDQGRRWDVEEALSTSPSSSTGCHNRPGNSEVILERWQVQLGGEAKEIPKDIGQILPRTYKNSIVLYRSLFTYAKLLPAWTLSKKLSKPRSTHSTPKLKYRIREERQFINISNEDALAVPLYETSDRVVEEFLFDPIDSPAGPLSVRVSYRSNCDFRIADSEELLSSHFMGMDEQFFEPSLARGDNAGLAERRYKTKPGEAGSLPPERSDLAKRPEQGQAYGSMSTFHQVGPPTSPSPLSALRAAREMGSQSPTEGQKQKTPPYYRSAHGSRSSLRSAEGVPTVGRKPSVPFMPFKTPSLSASPSLAEQGNPSYPRGSLGKASPLITLAEARAPSSSGTQATAIPPRSSNMQDPAVTAQEANSQKPTVTRYSSSFSHRKAKPSAGSSSRTEDDNNSSGKASITSSTAQPGSGIIAEGGAASSGSMPTDDDNISDFLKMLDQKKDLKSFRTAASDKAGTDSSARPNATALTKFQRMRDSNAALSDSMSSSVLHRSSSSSSRQLSGIPPILAGASTSAASSPGKPISPHTPHTPAIPSRLSANSIIEYPLRAHSSGEERIVHNNESRQESRLRNDMQNTGAIDIPRSPQPFHSNYRRSITTPQQPRSLPTEDDLEIFPYELRSASMGADDRPVLSVGALAALQVSSTLALPSVGNPDPHFGPQLNPEDECSAPMTRQQSSSLEGRDETVALPQRTFPYRPRIRRGGGRGQTSPHGSISSLVERGSGSGSSDQRGGRYSHTRPPSTFEESEPLLFAMSDFDAIQKSRRSLEDPRGGSSVGTSERGRADSPASSRRGSRRGNRPNSSGRAW